MTPTQTSHRSLMQDLLAIGPASTLRREVMLDLVSVAFIAIVFYVLQPAAMVVAVAFVVLAVYIAIRFAIGFTKTWKSE